MPKVYLRTPNSDEFSAIREKIQIACDKLGLEIFPREEEYQSCLSHASFLIADVTHNPDVAKTILEVGYAFRAGKSSLIIARKESEFSNIGQKNTLLYDPNELESFFAKLTTIIVMFCQQQRIRYQKYINMPVVTVEEPLPFLISCNTRVENFIALADDFIETYQYEDALQEYGRAILHLGQKSEPQPEHAYIFLKRAFVTKKLGRLENALEDYTTAIQLKPDYLDAYIARGITLYERQRYEEALSDFQKAAQIKPDFTRIYVLAGTMQRHNKKYDEALREFNRAIEINPEFPEAFYQRGILYTDLQNSDQAIEDFSKAITLHDKYVDAYIKRGLVYLSLHKYDLALSDFDKAIELAPDNVEAYSYRGQTLFEKGYKEFHELAIKDWEKAIALGHPNANILEEKIRLTSKTLG